MTASIEQANGRQNGAKWREPARRRGRPKGSSKLPPDHLQHIWVAVEVERRRGRKEAEQPRSVLAACALLERQGGLVSIVGGHRRAMLPEARRRNWRRYEPTVIDGVVGVKPAKAEVRPAKKGALLVDWSLQHSESIRARYTEANRLARNPAVRHFWMKIVDARLAVAAGSAPA